MGGYVVNRHFEPLAIDNFDNRKPVFTAINQTIRNATERNADKITVNFNAANTAAEIVNCGNIHNEPLM